MLRSCARGRHSDLDGSFVVLLLCEELAQLHERAVVALDRVGAEERLLCLIGLLEI